MPCSPDLHKKCQLIESFDERVVGKLTAHLKRLGDYRILVASSHAVGVDSMTPARVSVPWVLSGTGVKADKCRFFNEKEALASRFSSIPGHKLLSKTLLKN